MDEEGVVSEVGNRGWLDTELWDNWRYIKKDSDMTDTADTHEYADAYSLRVRFSPGLVVLVKVRMSESFLIKRQ